jgi:hypothetical protein
MRVQQRDLSRALERLQKASEAIGLPRRWGLENGSQTMGISYRLTDWHPYFGANTKEVGKTRAEALVYITTLVDAMELIRTVLSQKSVPSIGAEEWLKIPKELPQGLCADRGDHEPHPAKADGLGRFWCHADQSKRQPYASEVRLRRGITHGPDDDPEEGGVRMKP